MELVCQFCIDDKVGQQFAIFSFMNQHRHFYFSTGVIVYPLFFVLLIWVVFWAEVRLGFRFSKWGIYPQTLKGFRGVVFSPFIHGSILIANWRL